MTSKKTLNALKHGAFSEMILFPGEDQEQFDALHQALVDEWDPIGPTQADKVFNIAQNMWRKGRAKHRRKKAAIDRKISLRLRGSESDQLISFIDEVEAGRPISERDLPTRWASVLREAAPRQKYNSDSAWRAHVLANVKWLSEQLIISEELGEICDPRSILDELTLEERLDAKIDKDIVALGRMKTMQAMGLGRASSSHTIEGYAVEVPQSKTAQVDHQPQKAEEEE